MQEDISRPAMTVNGATAVPVAAAEWQSIEQAYREIQRRDERAEYRTWKAERRGAMLLGLLLVMLGWNIWLWLERRQVQAVVQVVQVDEQRRVVQLGIPQDVLSYQPADGQWMDMLGQWVHNVRWRDRESEKVHSRELWAWAERHTCSTARKLLDTHRREWEPFKDTKVVTAVELKSITQTAAPQSYQVLWKETTVGPNQPGVKETFYTGTFTVGRIRLTTLTDAMDNRLGLCVTGYDMSPMQTKP